MAPHNNATSLQVTAAVLGGVVWALEHPRAGVVEPEELDFARVLDIARPYLGEIVGVHGDWTPLDGRETPVPRRPRPRRSLAIQEHPRRLTPHSRRGKRPAGAAAERLVAGLDDRPRHLGGKREHKLLAIGRRSIIMALRQCDRLARSSGFK